ncbi:MAG: hypothetical protein JW822_13145 [Spirochaetales bacterium]|nr:hypothetical protein [Spirochaetales bacterium]
MKKIMQKAVVLSVFCCAVFLCFAEGPYNGVAPKGVQGAFYTKAYKCIYLKGSDELSGAPEVNKWKSYSVDITKTVGYDGMGGSRKGYSLVRIKANTASPNKEVAIYIDNVVLKDSAGNVIINFTFNDGENHGPYLSQGNKMQDNGNVVVLNGEKCFLLHAKSVNMYGYNGVEIQWNLPKNSNASDGSWDFSAGGFILSFDYYIATGG